MIPSKDPTFAALLAAESKALALLDAIETGGLIVSGRTELATERNIFTLAARDFGVIELGLHVSVAGLHRFFARHGMMRKKRLAMPSSRTGPTS